MYVLTSIQLNTWGGPSGALLSPVLCPMNSVYLGLLRLSASQIRESMGLCLASPSLHWGLEALSRASADAMVELISFVFQLFRITVLRGLKSSLLKTIVSYLLFRFFCFRWQAEWSLSFPPSLKGHLKCFLFISTFTALRSENSVCNIPTMEPTYISFVI